MKEFKKFAPDMIVRKYHGTQAEREVIREEMEMNFLRGDDPLDVVLTTFSYFSSDSNKGDRWVIFSCGQMLFCSVERSMLRISNYFTFP